ncbi:ankyrin repeat domain-containing protein [Micromonospora citrea]|uniref:ankyrin repeat domain-containing protein n=1 Tax=Micromonospora citrea TaxID=47855 RepID=UPI00159F0D2E|nr:ankyrin repeat domain-containing protein [Micromonospora citrea]
MTVLSDYLDAHGEAVERALHVTVQRGRLDLLECVLRHDPEQWSLDTSLALAAARPGSTPLLRALLDAGADPNSNGGLPLIEAIRGGDVTAVAVLLDAGADVNATSPWELRRPLDIAEDLGDTAVIASLLDRGARSVTTDEPDIERLAHRWATSARDAWKPVIEYGEAATTDTRSQLGGLPSLRAGEPWPVCTNCEEPLTFHGQIDLGQAPSVDDDRFGSGLLQMFYCLECDPTDPGGNLIRIIDSASPTAPAEAPDSVEVIPAHPVTGWHRPIKDHPTYLDEFDEAIDHASLTRDERDAKFKLNRSGDKLGGWPCWVHDSRYPPCPEDGEPMRQLILQIFHDTEDHQWRDGDHSGVGYVLQCPRHHEQVTLVWSCP